MEELDSETMAKIDKIISKETDPETGTFHVADVLDEVWRIVDDYDYAAILTYVGAARQASRQR